MPMPQTHFVITWIIWRFLSFVIGIKFSVLEIVSVFFWGVAIDIDHFSPWNWDHVKDFPHRIKRVLKGKGMGPSSIELKVAVFHFWPGFVLLALYTFLVEYFSDSFRIWIPFLFWFIHYWMMDRFGKNVKEGFPHISFFHPWKKKWIRKWGCSIKSRVEIIVFSLLFLLIVGFEIYFNLFR